MRWMKLEPIIQSEVSQKEKHQYSTLIHVYGISKKKQHSPSGSDLPLQFKNTPPSPLPAREEPHQELGGLVVLGILVEFAKLLRLQL